MAPSARGRAGGVQCSLLVLALAAPLASAGLGSAQHAALTGAPHFGSVAPLFGFALGGDRPLPSYTVSQPDPGSTLTQIRWPMCFGKHSAMLGSFCVAQQDPGSPDADKQGLDMQLQSAPGSLVTLFLFGDEDDAYGRFWKDAIANKSCHAMSKYALATLSPDASGRVEGKRQLKGKEAHLWYVVAVDCAARQCPNVSSVNITFMHPGSDGSHQVTAYIYRSTPTSSPTSTPSSTSTSTSTSTYESASISISRTAPQGQCLWVLLLVFTTVFTSLYYNLYYWYLKWFYYGIYYGLLYPGLLRRDNVDGCPQGGHGRGLAIAELPQRARGCRRNPAGNHDHVPLHVAARHAERRARHARMLRARSEPARAPLQADALKSQRVRTRKRDLL